MRRKMLSSACWQFAERQRNQEEKHLRGQNGKCAALRRNLAILRAHTRSGKANQGNSPPGPANSTGGLAGSGRLLAFFGDLADAGPIDAANQGLERGGDDVAVDADAVTFAAVFACDFHEGAGLGVAIFANRHH